MRVDWKEGNITGKDNIGHKIWMLGCPGGNICQWKPNLKKKNFEKQYLKIKTIKHIKEKSIKVIWERGLKWETAKAVTTCIHDIPEKEKNKEVEYLQW